MQNNSGLWQISDNTLSMPFLKTINLSYDGAACGTRSFTYLTALSVWVAPQLFSTETDEKPASAKASVSCPTVSGVS